MQVIFDLGEIRHIMLEVFSIQNDEFVISSASYVLKKVKNDEEEASGDCNINEHVLDAVIQPCDIGEYKLIITYKIADETLIDTVKVTVI